MQGIKRQRPEIRFPDGGSWRTIVSCRLFHRAGLRLWAKESVHGRNSCFVSSRTVCRGGDSVPTAEDCSQDQWSHLKLPKSLLVCANSPTQGSDLMCLCVVARIIGSSYRASQPSPIGRARPTEGGAIPGQVADYETGSKLIISVPPWSLLQSLPSGSCLSPLVTVCG